MNDKFVRVCRWQLFKYGDEVWYSSYHPRAKLGMKRDVTGCSKRRLCDQQKQPEYHHRSMNMDRDDKVRRSG